MDPNCKTNTHTYMPKRETSFSVKKEKKMKYELVLTYK